MRLDGKVALITGGGSGMGKVASELFASEGAEVVLTDVNDEAGEATAAAIGGRGRSTCTPTSRRRPTPRRWCDAAVDGSAGSTCSTTTPAIMPLDDGSVHRRRRRRSGTPCSR